MGPEPLSSDFSPSYLKERLKGKEAPIKALLMNNELVVGIGNIYASEILFESKVKPIRAGGKVNVAECERIVEVTRQVLQRSIESGGSSISDFRNLDGIQGHYQSSFQVYDRKRRVLPNLFFENSD